MLLYKLVNKNSAVVLEDAVQNFIDQGWEPIGRVTCSPTTVHEGSVVWAQAMIIQAASDVRHTEKPDNW